MNVSFGLPRVLQRCCGGVRKLEDRAVTRRLRPGQGAPVLTQDLLNVGPNDVNTVDGALDGAATRDVSSARLDLIVAALCGHWCPVQ